jgi:hypothetical protein
VARWSLEHSKVCRCRSFRLARCTTATSAQSNLLKQSAVQCNAHKMHQTSVEVVTMITGTWWNCPRKASVTRTPSGREHFRIRRACVADTLLAFTADGCAECGHYVFPHLAKASLVLARAVCCCPGDSCCVWCSVAGLQDDTTWLKLGSSLPYICSRYVCHQAEWHTAAGAVRQDHRAHHQAVLWFKCRLCRPHLRGSEGYWRYASSL